MVATAQDAIALLKADHRAVEALFEEFAATTAAAKQKTLARKICTELVIHTTIEEEILYPALAGKIDGDARHPASIQDTLKTLGEQIGLQFGLAVQ